MRFMISAILMSTLLSVLQENASGQVTVRLEVRGFLGSEGDLLLAVFNDPSQFPYDPFQDGMWPKDTLTGGVMVVEFSLPAPGRYGFSVLDDENGSGGMDKNIIGFPTERFGFSNDARPGLFRPPAYEDCLVDITKGMNYMVITIHK